MKKQTRSVGYIALGASLCALAGGLCGCTKGSEEKEPVVFGASAKQVEYRLPGDYKDVVNVSSVYWKTAPHGVLLTYKTSDGSLRTLEYNSWSSQGRNIAWTVADKAADRKDDGADGK